MSAAEQSILSLNNGTALRSKNSFRKEGLSAARKRHLLFKCEHGHVPSISTCIHALYALYKVIFLDNKQP